MTQEYIAEVGFYGTRIRFGSAAAAQAATDILVQEYGAEIAVKPPYAATEEITNSISSNEADRAVSYLDLIDSIKFKNANPVSTNLIDLV